MTERDVIDAEFITWTREPGSKPPTDRILAALDAAGYATYETATHAAVSRQITVSIFCALEAHAESRHPQRLWQPAWDAALAAAEAEAKETGDAG